jgi:Asp-tRNA(Asn)/Glu-tRNA(Gln) amidotransferase A subunit family amidase
MAVEPRTISELSRALTARHTTAEAVVERCLQRIAERNPTLNAFITVFDDEAREQARDADREIAAGRHRGPLHGVPISLKDLFDLRGSVTTAASRVRQAHVADRDATAVALLREAGAVIVGKTNLHEFALGTTNEDSAFGPARHPLDPSRSPGGSSGGSAAAVADGMCFASIGSDTGGSIRIPAAACGLVGLKPTYGELPTDGVVPLSPTLDHIGPICRSVEDAAIVYDVLRGGRGAADMARDSRPLRVSRLPANGCANRVRRSRMCLSRMRERSPPSISTSSCPRLRRITPRPLNVVRMITRRMSACGSRWDVTSLAKTMRGPCVDAS